MKKRTTSPQIEELQPNEIFVFGSNLDGFHGGGAAKLACEKWGAIWGQGVGLQGQTYAIPTMQGGTETIKPYVDEFIQFAKENYECSEEKSGCKERCVVISCFISYKVKSEFYTLNTSTQYPGLFRHNNRR